MLTMYGMHSERGLWNGVGVGVAEIVQESIDEEVLD